MDRVDRHLCSWPVFTGVKNVNHKYGNLSTLPVFRAWKVYR